MTWYASEIFLKPNQNVHDFLIGDSKFSGSSYFLPSKIEYQINEKRNELSLGESGLYVVRPICDPSDHCASWFEEAIIDWNFYDAKETIISPIDMCISNDDVEPENLPPIGFLAYVKSIAKELETDIVVFHSFMWGGDTEFEYSWFFGQREEAFMMLESGVESVVDHRVFRGVSGKLKVDILTEAINYLGGKMISPFCPFHTRGFDWSSYVLKNA